jgi:hypothetical protein
LEAPDIEWLRFTDGFVMQIIRQAIASASGDLCWQIGAQLGVASSKHTRQWGGVVLFGRSIDDREVVTLCEDFAE